MSRSQRLAFLAIAVVIAVIAVVVLSGGGDDGGSETAATPTATPAATATTAPAEGETPEPAATPKPKPTPEIVVLRPGSVKRIQAKEGDSVTFAVRSDKADEVHVHGYDIKQDVRPGREVNISFKATITGIFEIELEAAHEPLGNLVVEPK